MIPSGVIPSGVPASIRSDRELGSVQDLRPMPRNAAARLATSITRDGRVADTHINADAARAAEPSFDRDSSLRSGRR